MQRRNTTRPGFTLVEMMMVIIIIGMLVSLIGVAVSAAVRAAKRARIKVEISNLDMAMQKFKNDYGGQYPPCMAILSTTSTPSRDNLFNTAWRKRFPRSADDYGKLTDYSAMSSNPLKLWSVANLNIPDPHGTTAGAIQLDIRNMDAAEALVFWLAGPPTPIDPSGKYTSNTLLWGFSASPTNPFLVTGARAAALFEFDETRLTDLDADGWPEYGPPISVSLTHVAPYVYFDSASYQFNQGAAKHVACYPGYGTLLNSPPATYPLITAEPSPKSINPPGSPMAALVKRTSDEFGFALPYAESFAPTNSTVPPPIYWHSKSCQIICCGLDGEYGASASETYGSPPQIFGVIRPNQTVPSPFTVPLVPKTGAAAADLTPILMQGELDNLTNFAESTLEDVTPK